MCAYCKKTLVPCVHQVHKGAMTLSDYLTGTGLTYTAFAPRIGCTSQHVSKIARGVEMPSAHMALQIEAATHGQVTRESLRPDIYPTATSARDPAREDAPA